LKITFVAPDSGCAWWRIKQPAKMIERLGLAEVRYFDIQTMHPDDFEEMIEWGELIVMQSAMGVKTVASVIRMKELGKTVIGDYDDLSFTLSPFNPAYKTLGLSEVWIDVHKDGEKLWLWKDNERGFSLEANKLRYQSLQHLLTILDGVTVTTPFIKNEYFRYTPEIFILPNSIDFNLFKPFPKEKHEQIRIGWTASDSHYAEFWMIVRIMRKLFDKYGKRIRFVLLGNLYELKKHFSNDELECHEFIGLNTYPLKLASLSLDIGLCPLVENEFNKAKSQLKWSEFSALEIPCVCSRLQPYDCVENGITGMIGNNEEEFYNSLCELIENPPLRDKISSNAYTKNYEDYNLEKNVLLWMDVYEQIMDKANGILIKPSESIIV